VVFGGALRSDRALAHRAFRVLFEPLGDALLMIEVTTMQTHYLLLLLEIAVADSAQVPLFRLFLVQDLRQRLHLFFGKAPAHAHIFGSHEHPDEEVQGVGSTLASVLLSNLT